MNWDLRHLKRLRRLAQGATTAPFLRVSTGVSLRNGRRGDPFFFSLSCPVHVICMFQCKHSRLYTCVLTGDLGKGVESDRRHAEPVH